MLDVGGFSTRTCHGHSRRAFLRTASSLPLTWGLSPAFNQSGKSKIDSSGVALGRTKPFGHV